MNATPGLFGAGKIGALKTKNRLVMSPMVLNYAHPDGRVSRRYLAHMARIARGGVGTMILEASYVAPEGKGFTHELGIHSDAMIPGLADVVAAAHECGVVIGIQLYHAGRQTSSAVTGTAPVAPSPLPDPLMQEMPRVLTQDDIQHLVHAFAQAARRARLAGFDFVELHAAHGYLINEFLSPFTNRRDDRYGGSEENRARFVLETIAAVQRLVGADFPITVRISADEMVPGGLTPDDSALIAARLEKAGVAAIHVSAGIYASYPKGQMIQPMAVDDGPLLPLAARIRKAVRIPVIAVGKIRSPALAERALDAGQADFIALGRSLLADPDWPRKAEDGRAGDINHCIACNQGCIGRLFENLDVWCTVEPATGREEDFERRQIGARKKVLVVGGGPAGMEAAIIAARCGHQPVLCDRADHLGGQLIAAGSAPHRPGWDELRRHLTDEIEKAGVEVRLNTEVTTAYAQTDDYDAVILATGARAAAPEFPAGSGPTMASARDILEGRVKVEGKVVVAGGGCAGAQTAEYLALQGADVTVVEAQAAVAVDAPLADRALLLQRLHELKVKLLTDTRIIRLDADQVTLENPWGTWEVPAQALILCLGARPEGVELAHDLRRVMPRVIVAGDALEPRRVTEAMADGALAALSL